MSLADRDKKLALEDIFIDIGASSIEEVINDFGIEVGARGSQVTARKIKPDLAIVIEGTPADDIYFEEYAAQGTLNKGTQIRHIDSSMIGNPKFIKFSKEIAKANNIAYQSAARTQGSTNGGKIHLSNAGVPTLVLGIPVRYAHTHYCYSASFDIEATINLVLQVIKGLTLENAKAL